MLAPPAVWAFGEDFAWAVHHDLGQHIVVGKAKGLEIALEHALPQGSPRSMMAPTRKALQDLRPAHGFVTGRTVRSRTCVRSTDQPQIVDSGEVEIAGDEDWRRARPGSCSGSAGY